MNIAIVGAGAMGKLLKSMIDEREEMKCIGIVEPLNGDRLESIGYETEKIDVVVDFSNPANLNMIEEYARDKGCSVVIATTGFSPDQLAQIQELSLKVPVVQTANFSLGITVMKRILQEITPILKDSFDIEIVEKHHNKKLDAPSGTAKLLESAINSNGEFAKVFGREGNHKRGKEIGIHAVRGGSLAGEHTVMFAGEDEVLEFNHMAGSKKIFAIGAIRAAEFVYQKMQMAEQNEAEDGMTGAGLYSMEDVLF